MLSETEKSMFMVSFLKTLDKIYRKEESFDKSNNVDSVIVQSEFYDYMIRKELIKSGQRYFKGININITYDKNSDIWGLCLSKGGERKNNE